MRQKSSAIIPPFEDMSDVINQLQRNRDNDNRKGYLVSWLPENLGPTVQDLIADEQALQPFVERGFVMINERYYTFLTKQFYRSMSSVSKSRILGKLTIYARDKDAWIQRIARLAKDEVERRELIELGMM